MGREARGGWQRSLVIALARVTALTGLRMVLTVSLMGGGFMGGVFAFRRSLGLPAPWSAASALMALLAYGPGESLGVLYYISALDTATGQTDRLLSWGVVIASLVWAFPISQISVSTAGGL